MNILERDRYSMLDEKEQKVFDELHEILTDSLDIEKLWKEYIDRSPLKYPDIGDFVTLFETVLDTLDEAIEEKDNEEERADIAVDRSEEIEKIADNYHNALCNIEDCTNMDQVQEILNKVLYK